MKEVITKTAREIMNALHTNETYGRFELTFNRYFDRVTVTANGEYYGIWDTEKKTFVD